MLKGGNRPAFFHFYEVSLKESLRRMTEENILTHVPCGGRTCADAAD